MYIFEDWDGRFFKQVELDWGKGKSEVYTGT